MNDFFLKTLTLLIREPNLSLVAEKLKTSQSNLSKILKRMEEEWGVQLFERKGFRGLLPTPEAIRLAKIAEQLSQEWNVNLNLIKNKNVLRPDLRVIAPLLWTKNFFIPFWYQSKWAKQLRLIMSAIPLGEINFKTVGANYDIVISNTTNYLESYNAKKIYTEKSYLIFNQKTAPETLEKLNFAKYKWLAYKNDADPMQNFLKENNFSAEIIHSYVNDLSILVAIVKSQLNFVACIPDHLYKIEKAGLTGFELPIKEKGDIFFMSKPEQKFSKDIYLELKDFIKEGS